MPQKVIEIVGTYSYAETRWADYYNVPSFLGTPGGCVWMYLPYSLPPALLIQGDAAGCD